MHEGCRSTPRSHKPAAPPRSAATAKCGVRCSRPCRHCGNGRNAGGTASRHSETHDNSTNMPCSFHTREVSPMATAAHALSSGRIAARRPEEAACRNTAATAAVAVCDVAAVRHNSPPSAPTLAHFGTTRRHGASAHRRYSRVTAVPPRRGRDVALVQKLRSSKARGAKCAHGCTRRAAHLCTHRVRPSQPCPAKTGGRPRMPRPFSHAQ